MYVVVLLGEGDKFLTYRAFANEDDATNFVLDIEAIAKVNADDGVSLKERIAIIKQLGIAYFPKIGAVRTFEVLELTDVNTLLDAVRYQYNKISVSGSSLDEDSFDTNK